VEFSLLGAVLIAVAGLYGVLWWEAGRANAPDSTRDLWDMALGAGIAGLLVGRVAAMIGDGTNPITHPGDLIILRSGVDTGFASLTALFVLAWLARRDLWRTLDALAPAAVAGLAAWHGSCLIRGSCLGTPTTLPWGLAQTGSEVARHPVEVYAALLLAAAAVGLIALKYRRRPAGVVAGLALAATGLVRLATEPLRPVIGAGPEIWYVAALGAGLGFTIGSVVRARRGEGGRYPA
jgi:prolipoprotein diacylglyceryltransferase